MPLNITPKINIIIIIGCRIASQFYGMQYPGFYCGRPRRVTINGVWCVRVPDILNSGQVSLLQTQLIITELLAKKNKTVILV